MFERKSYEGLAREWMVVMGAIGWGQVAKAQDCPHFWVRPGARTAQCLNTQKLVGQAVAPATAERYELIGQVNGNPY